MAVCRACGSDIRNGVSFCTQCGASIDAPHPAEDGLLDPFGVSSSSGFVSADKSASRLPAVIGIGLIAALVAFFVVVGGSDDNDESDDIPELAFDDGGRDEPDEPLAAVTVVDDTTEPTIVAGQLDVVPVDLDLSGWVVGTHELGDSTFVFISDDGLGPPPWFPSRGIRTLERGPSGAWVDHGRRLSDVAISAMTTTTDRLYAVGVDAEGNATLWESADGVDWTAESMPTIDTTLPVVPQQVAAIGDTVVVRGGPRDPYVTLLADLDAAGIDFRPQNGWSLNGTEIDVRGPFGVVLDTIDLAELGIDPPNTFWFEDEPAGAQWARNDGEWTVERVVYQFGEIGLLAGPDDRFVQLSGPSIEVSDDGITWEEVSQPINAWRAAVWNDSYVTVNDIGGYSIIDADFTTSNRRNLPAITQGAVNDIAAGPLGLLITAYDIRSFSEQEQPARTDVVIRRDGVTLTVTSESNQRIIVETELERTHNLDLYNIDPRTDLVRVDTDAETLTFVHPDSGTDVITVSFDELEVIETSIHGGRTGGPPPLKVFFTPDGQTWSETPAELVTPAGTTPGPFHIGTDHITFFAWDSTTNNGFGGGEILVYEATLSDDG